ncbi:MAG: general secretion pathway protein GspB [Rhodoferax sp.]|uniref:general secretion pathway protein GspB n=1 Tax=Rhodoferax sp. TaxID=50421 RepID=UPI00261604DC|nr:general secretion pathway protein GspB [Rhodoferax sp.]MDD2882311.1 general secretion pathway protein GspB [Rhodoferax sp.]
MSYILDALKRADAERSRGAVPGLHARQLPSAGGAAPPPLQNRVGLLLVAAGLLCALAFGLWAWRTPTEVPGISVPAAQQAAPQTPPTIAVNAQATSPKAAVKAALPSPMGPSLAKSAGTHASTAAANPTTTKAADPASVAALQTAKASAPPATPLLSELPDALRRQIPALTITGTVYADDPKLRLLLVNNQVLTQGSVVAPELTLEEIRQHSAVFNFRGTQFRVAR